MNEEFSEVPQQSSQSAANHISAGGNVSIGNITLISSAENLSRVNLPNAITCKDSSTFIGREQELEFLWASLEKHRLAIISGICGSGKTELAKQFIRQYGSAYLGGIFWADRSSPTEQIANSFFTHRQNFQKNFIFLLICDDVPIGEYAVLLETWQTQFGGNLHILVTTQEHLEDDFVCSLGGLSSEESLQLLEAFAGNNRVSSARFYRQYGAEERLIEKLGHLPLAIEAIGKFLSYNSELSMSDLLEQIEDAGLSHPALIEEVGTPLEDIWGELELSEFSQSVVFTVGLFPDGASKKTICRLFPGSSEFAVHTVGLLCCLNLASETQHKAETHFAVNPIVRLFLEEKLTEYENSDEITEKAINVLCNKEAHEGKSYENSKFLYEDAIRISERWSRRELQVTALQALAYLTLCTAFKETNKHRPYRTSRHYYESKYLLNSSKEYYFQAKEILTQCEDEFHSDWNVCSLNLFVFLFKLKHEVFERVLLQCFKVIRCSGTASSLLQTLICIVIRCFIGLLNFFTNSASLLWQSRIPHICIAIIALCFLFQPFSNPEKKEVDTRQIPADTHPETPVPSPSIQVSPEAPETLSFEGAGNLVWSYLEALKQAYIFPDKAKDLKNLIGGKLGEDIENKLKTLRKDGFSYRDTNELFEQLKFKDKFFCDQNRCVFTIKINRGYTRSKNKNIAQMTYCLTNNICTYRLQNENGIWKIYDFKKGILTIDDPRWRSE